MGRAKRRAILWGTMILARGKRRSYVFRVEPNGLLAIRVGNPLSWLAFFTIVLAFYILLRGTPIGLASLFAGGAVGFAVLGTLDKAIARAVATQPQETLMRSHMNLFLPSEEWRAARVEEAGPLTRLHLSHSKTEVRITIHRPRPPHARRFLGPLLRTE